MSTAKRNRTSSAGEGHATSAKVVKTSHESDSAVAGELPVERHSDEVQVTAEIYSVGDGRRGGVYLPGNTLDEGDDMSDEDDDIPTRLFNKSGEQKWFKYIHSFANVGQSRVADYHAKLFSRDSVRSAFWTEMEALCEESSLLAFELFDRYGRLNREYAEREVKKGSCVWGKELDHGDILMIESIRVEPLWRHQGVGAKLVSAVLDKARHEPKDFFTFINPMHLTVETVHNDEKPDSDTICEIFKHLFRSLGFRRVGASGWLAFSGIESHPSRHLDKARDWDPPDS